MVIYAQFVKYNLSKIHSFIHSFQTSDIATEPLTSSEVVSFQLQSTEGMPNLTKQCVSASCTLDPIPTILLKDNIIKPRQLCWEVFIVMPMCVFVSVCLLTRYLKNYLTNHLHF